MTEATSFRERYIEAQLAGDRAVALAVVVEAIDAGVPVPRVHLEIIQEAQREIGRLWEENVISISMEHQATAISQLALATLYDRMPRAARNGKLVIVACVEGELHDMGARVAADFLEMAGFDVRLFGANVPAAALVERALALRPDLIALSATMEFHLGALRSAIDHVRASPLAPVPILVGGLAFGALERAKAEIDAQGFGANAEELVAEAGRLVGTTARAV